MSFEIQGSIEEQCQVFPRGLFAKRKHEQSDSSDNDYEPTSELVGACTKRKRRSRRREAIKSSTRKTHVKRGSKHMSYRGTDFTASLPDEILLKIFQLAVEDVGVVPLLPRFVH